MITDALVIGAGTAGLTAGIRLARGGLRVTVVASGEGCLPLASGTIDILGFAPEAVQSPRGALPGFLDANPEHPYRISGLAGLEQSLAWFVKTTEPLGYRGELSRNQWVPTVLGGLRPTALVPRSMAAADLGGGGEVLIAGIRGFRDFHPALLAANLGRTAAPAPAIRTRAVELEWPGSAGDMPPFRLARRLEDPEIRRRLAAQLHSQLGDATAVGLPAVLGRERAAEVHADLEQRLGRAVFEIPGLPPSLPGLRLFDCLRRALLDAGGRLLLGSTAISATQHQDTVESVTITQASRPVAVSAGFFVLATGASPLAASSGSPTVSSRSLCSACRCMAWHRGRSPSATSTWPSTRWTASGSAPTRRVVPWARPEVPTPSTSMLPARCWPAPSPGARSPARV